MEGLTDSGEKVLVSFLDPSTSLHGDDTPAPVKEQQKKKKKMAEKNLPQFSTYSPELMDEWLRSEIKVNNAKHVFLEIQTRKALLEMKKLEKEMESVDK